MTINAKKCLVVEDERDIRDLVSLILSREGYSVEAVADPTQARARIAENTFDLIIVDWMLPGESGVDLIRQLRSDKRSDPVLILTAKSQPEDVVEGLKAGADDYLTKPFDNNVLLARAEALVRRKKWSEELQNRGNKSVYQWGGIYLDVDRHEVRVEDQTVHLTPSEYKILLEMLKNVGRVLTRDYLISKVQGEGIAVTGRTIDTHVFALRKKMMNQADLIETIRGVGYRIRDKI
ncbi:MAG: response regulator transcription factor [Bdellovibrionaceae bacterium]|nr:response regulator transcription factor [Pseudobdellovibrionaceae bacterium]MDW8189592.1 response regulator transcription factor [Pseudobdellovibrionaceae bacterium]